MPEGMHGVFRLTVLGDDTGSTHDRCEVTQQSLVLLDRAGGGRKTRSSSPFGHANFHVFRAVMVSGDSGTLRRLSLVFGLTDGAVASARWRTCNSPALKSTSDQRRPRSSEARKPHSAATRSRA